MTLSPEVFTLWADFAFYKAVLWCFITLRETQSSLDTRQQTVWKSEGTKLELLTENFNVFSK